MPQTFNRAVLRFFRQLRRRWWFFLPLIIWEIAKDRVAGWANTKINQEIGAVVKTTVQILEYAASSPITWTIAAAVLVVLLIFLHSYFMEARRNNTGLKPDEKQETIVSPVSPSPASQARKKKAEALAGFLFSADEIINRQVNSDMQLNIWKEDYQNWHTEVINFLRANVSHTSAYHFSNPGLLVVSSFSGTYNDEHNSLVNCVSRDRENLRHLHALESD